MESVVKQIIIEYCGGLGNQMFQYAFAQMLRNKGVYVYDDISFYKNQKGNVKRNFELERVFKNCSFTFADEDKRKKILQEYGNRGIIKKVYNKAFPMTKQVYEDRMEIEYDKKIVNKTSGILRGYWQSYKYFESIKENIYETYTFDMKKCNDKVLNLINNMEGCNSVSMHVRAGDYLTKENARIFGGICTEDYYKRAIKEIRKRVSNPVFYVFSNDIQYCKKKLPIDNVVWVDEDIISKHENWEEMMLMSKCKYNIIANSTFSWWGAWLNIYGNKIVIAPKTWLNTHKRDDICPKEWIRM